MTGFAMTADEVVEQIELLEICTEIRHDERGELFQEDLSTESALAYSLGVRFGQARGEITAYSRVLGSDPSKSGKVSPEVIRWALKRIEGDE